MKHLFKVYRYSDNGDSTLSFCHYNGKLYMYGLEDEYREVKVKGETRIPAKRYKLGIKDVITPKTIAYRKKYKWFDRHVEILGVDNFTDVYIHIGNFEVDTDACYLTGNKPNINTLEKGMVSASVKTFKRFYQFVFPLLLNGKDAYIEFIDLDRVIDG